MAPKKSSSSKPQQQKQSTSQEESTNATAKQNTRSIRPNRAQSLPQILHNEQLSSETNTPTSTANLNNNNQNNNMNVTFSVTPTNSSTSIITPAQNTQQNTNSKTNNQNEAKKNSKSPKKAKLKNASSNNKSKKGNKRKQQASDVGNIQRETPSKKSKKEEVASIMEEKVKDIIANHWKLVDNTILQSNQESEDWFGKPNYAVILKGSSCESIFNAIITADVLNFLCGIVNSQIAEKNNQLRLLAKSRSTRVTQYPLITANEFKTFMGMVFLAEQKRSAEYKSLEKIFDAHRDDYKFFLGNRRFQLIINALVPGGDDLESLIEIFNSAFERVWCQGTIGSFDESIYQFQPTSDTKEKFEKLEDPVVIRFIPRKPHALGLMSYNFVNAARDSKQPFMVNTRPLYHQHEYSPKEALKLFIRKHFSTKNGHIVADAAFGDESILDLLDSLPNNLTGTFSMSSNSLSYLWDALKSNLKPKSWRAVYKDSKIASVYADTSLDFVDTSEEMDCNDESNEVEQEKLKMKYHLVMSNAFRVKNGETSAHFKEFELDLVFSALKETMNKELSPQFKRSDSQVQTVTDVEKMIQEAFCKAIGSNPLQRRVETFFSSLPKSTADNSAAANSQNELSGIYSYDLLMQRSVRDLREICQSHTISQRGNKSELALRLSKHFNSTEKDANMVRDFIRKLSGTGNTENSPIHDIYRSHFNGVDKANKIYYSSVFQFKVLHWRTKWVFILFSIAMMNAFTIARDVSEMTFVDFKTRVVNGILQKKVEA